MCLVMEYMLENSETSNSFLVEARRRTDLMVKYGLLHKNALEYLKNDTIWCGFLFVGGDLNDSVSWVKELKDGKRIDDFRFLYHPDKTVERININRSMNYKAFVNQNRGIRKKEISRDCTRG